VDNKERSFAYKEIAGAQAISGDVGGAKTTVTEIKEAYGLSMALRSIKPESFDVVKEL